MSSEADQRFVSAYQAAIIGAMYFDSITLAWVLEELRQRLISGIIKQIYQPQPNLLTLEIWNEQALKLLISAEHAALYLTQASFENPQKPSDFCMLLRKYLKHGRIKSITQPGLERIADLCIQQRDGEYTLRCELLGKSSNVLLIDSQGVILGALKQGIGKRQIIPGAVYQPLPPQNKLNPLHAEKSHFIERLKALSNSIEIQKALLTHLEGIGPRLAQELCLRAKLEPSQLVSSLSQEELDTLWAAIQELFRVFMEKTYRPVIYYKHGEPLDCAPFTLTLYADLESQERGSLCAALDECYTQKLKLDEFQKAFQELSSVLKEKRKKLEEVLKKVEQDLAEAEGYEKYRQEADLVMANLHRLKKGVREIELEDFFKGGTRNIALDPKLSPIENAQALYKKYKKLKRGLEKLLARKAELQLELDYLSNVQNNLEQADSKEDLLEIRAELQEVGYLNSLQVRKLASLQESQKPMKREIRTGPREFVIDGYKVLVGKSGRQNDALIRNASKEDYWLHVRDRAGAHVIVRNPKGEPLPEQVLLKAAQLAAYYSKARDAKKALVSYTLVKYLRKPKGVKPGLVILMKEEGTITVQSLNVESLKSWAKGEI